MASEIPRSPAEAHATIEADRVDEVLSAQHAHQLPAVDLGHENLAVSRRI